MVHWRAPLLRGPLWLRTFSAERSEEQSGFHPAGLRVPNMSPINDLIESRLGEGQTQKIPLSGTDRAGCGAGLRGSNWLGSTTSRILKEFTDVPQKVLVVSVLGKCNNVPASSGISRSSWMFEGICAIWVPGLVLQQQFWVPWRSFTSVPSTYRHSLSFLNYFMIRLWSNVLEVVFLMAKHYYTTLLH